MTAKTRDLLLEIGCEELPASFVDAALAALPELARKKLTAHRLAFGAVAAHGTPRRLALLVSALAERQPDLDEEVLGPPVSAAFKNDQPTRAAEAFATKLGVSVSDLRRVPTPKGEYVAGTRKEAGQAAMALLPTLLAEIIAEIPFRKSMRWADLDVSFGRPVQWLVALFGGDVVGLSWAGLVAGRTTRGHRFLVPAGAAPDAVAPVAIAITSPASYVDQLRAAHVFVDSAERKAAMQRALAEGAMAAGGTLIEDAFLVEENASLVEEPFVVVGSFDTAFLELPERVILEVAKGHQRYFGLRSESGALMPGYLAVVNTARCPDKIARGNDRVMRARLADAQFFWRTDKSVPLAARRDKLAGIVFQKRLGTVLDKVVRIEHLTRALGAMLGLSSAVVEVAVRGAGLAKCDLVSLMVGELPELEGQMGQAYAIAEGIAPDVADVICEHYRPRGSSDEPARAPASALVAIADRLDTLTGCFAIGLTPTGAADPYALRRACLGVLRTLLAHSWHIDMTAAFNVAYAELERGEVKLDGDRAATLSRLSEFTTDRLRGLLEGQLPGDAVRAALGSDASDPVDARARAAALAGLDEATRASVGEVFKRAANIAAKAEGSPSTPALPPRDVHPSESALLDAFQALDAHMAALGNGAKADYPAALSEIGAIAPLMARYFEDVFVMSEDLEVRAARLELMRAIATTCGRVARLELLSA